eukprot:c8932_g1_i1.p1 GENE.c8932_g1_i1~~c8932_g1_i1.p1  ORF type:complete len:324 (+),score=62.01 c8932_g1_i1:112-972(+)
MNELHTMFLQMSEIIARGARELAHVSESDGKSNGGAQNSRLDKLRPVVNLQTGWHTIDGETSLSQVAHAQPAQDTQPSTVALSSEDFKPLDKLKDEKTYKQTLNDLADFSDVYDMNHEDASSKQSSFRLDQSRTSLALDEAHSVPATTMFWLAAFLYGLGRNTLNSNPSAPPDMEPANPTAVSKEFSVGSSSSSSLEDGASNAAGENGNSSTQSSVLVGNFFMGWAVVSLLLAIMFAPKTQAKVLATNALQMLTGINFDKLQETIEAKSHESESRPTEIVENPDTA